MSVWKRSPYGAPRPSLMKGSAGLIALWALAGITPLAAMPPTEGTMAVAAQNGDGSRDAASAMVRDAAERALAMRGFTLLDGAHAAYHMDVVVRVNDVGTGNARVAPSRPDILSGGMARGVGSILKVPVPSGKSRNVALEKTQIEMILRRRGGDAVIWRGAAVTVRPAETQPEVAASLCDALVRAYPAQSDDVIGVP